MYPTKRPLAWSKLLLTTVLAAFCQAAQAESVDWPTLLTKKPMLSEFKISPSGQYLAAKVYIEGKQALVFLDATTMKPIGNAAMGGDMQVGEYHWVNNERVVFKITETVPWRKEPLYYGELFGVNVDGSKRELLFGYRAGEQQVGTNFKKREGRRAWAEFVDIVPDQDGKILISSTPSSDTGDRLAEVLLMDVYTGKTQSRGKVPVSYSTVFTSPDGKPRVVVGTNRKDETEVYIREPDSNDWKQVPASSYGNTFHPIAVSSDNQGLYVTDNLKNDKTGVYKISFKDGSYKEIFTDEKVDVSDIAETADGRAVYGIRVDDGMPAYVLLSSAYEEAKIFKDLLGAFPGEKVKITSHTLDGKKWVVVVGSDVNPATYYLYDNEKVSLSKLAESRPELTGKPLANMEPIQFKSFDGRQINGYLTQSPLKSAAKPMVVLVHGGPHQVRDYWSFDPEVQLLAMSGYNVLQVNFRGSSGFGQEYEAAGYLQWGDAIQKDIIAGTEWAISQGHAKAGNICIMGGSFGGYSVVQASAMAPDLYRCGVAVAGVYDLSIMSSEGDVAARDNGKAYLKRVLGTDPKVLAAYSPVNNVANLKTKLLIAHGEKDERAPMVHAERLRKALDNAGKSYQWLQFDDETHGFYGEQNQQQYFKTVQQFLGTHLKI